MTSLPRRMYVSGGGGEVSHVLRILFSSLDPTNEFQYLALCLDALGLRPHFKNLCWS